MKKLTPYIVTQDSTDGTFQRGEIIWQSENGDINSLQGCGWVSPDECDPDTLDFLSEETAEYEVVCISGHEICQKREGPHMTEIKKIRKMLTEDELLCQLSEEASELAKAALKLRRAMMGVNPTPVSYPDARENLLEEYGDVLNAMEAIITPTENAYAVDRRMHKRTRWVERLEEHYGKQKG